MLARRLQHRPNIEAGHWFIVSSLLGYSLEHPYSDGSYQKYQQIYSKYTIV